MTKEAKKAKPSLVKLEETNTDTPVLVLEGEVIPAVTIVDDQEVIKAVEPEDKGDGSIRFGFAKKEGPGYRRSINSVTDKPILLVAGSEIELTKMTDMKSHLVEPKIVGGKLRSYRQNGPNILVLPAALGYRMTPYENEVLSDENCEWWTATIRDVEIIMSSGSEMFIDSELAVVYDHYYDGRDARGNPKLTVIGSKVDAKCLYVGGNAVINNTQIVGNYVELDDVTISASYLSCTNGSVSIGDSVLSNTNIHDTDSIHVKDSELISTSLSGGRSITAKKAYNFYGPFKLSIYSRNTLSIALSGTLQSYDAYHHIEDIPVDKERGYGQPTVNVVRRVDYGVFNAIETLPFVRLNEYDLLVSGEVFSAKEFYPEFFTSKEPKKSVFETPGSVSQYTGLTMTPWVSMERGGELWNRAAKIAFRYNTKAIGKSGNEIVKSLLDAIRSRIGLYIEIYNLEP